MRGNVEGFDAEGKNWINQQKSLARFQFYGSLFTLLLGNIGEAFLFLDKVPVHSFKFHPLFMVISTISPADFLLVLYVLASVSRSWILRKLSTEVFEHSGTELYSPLTRAKRQIRLVFTFEMAVVCVTIILYARQYYLTASLLPSPCCLAQVQQLAQQW